MASDRHTRLAKEICAPSFSGGAGINDEQHIRDVATALAQADREGLRRAAEIFRQEEAACPDAFYRIDAILSQAGEDN